MRYLAMLSLCVAVANAQTSLVIVSGIGGEAKYTQSFAQMSSTLAQAAHDRAKLGDSSITWLGEPTAPKSRWLRGTSTRENVERILAQLAVQSIADAQIVIVLIGHGSGEGADTRISLPGPDITASDFAKLLARFGARRVAFINLTSASGDMLPVVAGPSRVVMTATKSAFERNESQFARYFVDAFTRDGADTDKDGRISLLEAFRYADAETKRFYETESRLPTEHAQLSDESEIAGRFFLTPGASERTGSAGGARLAALYAEQTSLDQQIATLKKRKQQMTADAYDAELERLLVALALKSREIRQLERGT